MEGIGIIRIFVTAKVNMKRIFRKKMTEEVVCEYRLFFLYVGDPEIFVIHGIHGGHGDFC